MPPKTLKEVMRELVANTDMPSTEIAKKVGTSYYRISNMVGGSTKSIQPDVALKLARVLNIDADVFKDYLADAKATRSARGQMTRRQKKQRGEKTTSPAFTGATTFVVDCPHCAGTGKMVVRPA